MQLLDPASAAGERLREHTGIPAACLTLEITESAAVDIWKTRANS
jgi:EAL domain-containing protein (putative c-di-GMP-specific phosphodiesterase class I)